MGFKITRDFVKDAGTKGVTGKESAPPTHWLYGYVGKTDEDYLYKGGKIKVRLTDDDGGILFHAVVDEEDFSCEMLLDWGARYAGATGLDMSKADWDTLHNGRKHPYESKDGKWVQYMG